MLYTIEKQFAILIPTMPHAFLQVSASVIVIEDHVHLVQTVRALDYW
jgi:hypothetical protein